MRDKKGRFVKGHDYIPKTEEGGENIRNFMKGNNHGFKKGFTPWNKNLTKEEIPQMKNAGIKKGQKHSGSFKKGHDLYKHPNVRKAQFKKGQLIGEKHWNWKGGITPYNILLRQSDEYKLWRDSVYKRDKYNCQFCGSIKNIRAHHIIPFTECLVLDWEEEIFDVDNGLTLCEKCHKKEHPFNRVVTDKLGG